MADHKNTKDRNRIISNFCINVYTITKDDVVSEKFSNYVVSVVQDLLDKIPDSNDNIR